MSTLLPVHGQLIDLHRHLDGSLRLSTLRELALNAKVTLPDKVEFSVGMGLEAALALFQCTLATLQTAQAVRRVASEICEDADQEGVEYLEIRFAPQLHLGGSINSIIEAALEGINGRAGLILCGLYGEDPDAVSALVKIGAQHKGVVGIDLAGAPSPSHSWSMIDYAPAFQRAAEAGLGRTVHAGEGRPPEEIRVAIEHLLAQRIGHGTTLLQDEAILELVIEREITVEACPTSNLHTGVISSMRDHPLADWLNRGVQACICTDNTLLSAVDAPTEYQRALTISGMNSELLKKSIAYASKGAFNRS